MIESVELVVAALSAGAAAGAGNATSTAVQDAYQGLKSLTRKALRRGDVGDVAESDAVVEATLADPSAYREVLAEVLSKAGVAEDDELLTAARRVLDLVESHASYAEKYRVVLNDSQGVQVGDHNTQTNTFGSV